MLPKKFRLPIQEWNKKNKKKIFTCKKSKYFIVKSTSNNLPFSRFGIIISQKVNKKATRRNKIKRIIFDFIRLKGYHLKKGKDILIFAFPLVNSLTKEEIEKELNNLIT